MDHPSIIDQFHRAIHREIAKAVDDRTTALARGAAGDYPSYQRQVGFLEAMGEVLRLCKEIETEMYGKRPGDKGEAT